MDRGAHRHLANAISPRRTWPPPIWRVEAARAALAQRGIAASELDAILVCTVTPDMLFPSTACLVQHNIGATEGLGIRPRRGLLRIHLRAHHRRPSDRRRHAQKVLVIGADTMTRIIDYTDRATCILFGDGAGAMLLEPSRRRRTRLGFIDFLGEIDGSGGDFLKMPAGGSRMPASAKPSTSACTTSTRTASRFSSTPCARCTKSAATCSSATVSPARTSALMIPHQANRRIIAATAERLGIALR